MKIQNQFNNDDKRDTNQLKYFHLQMLQYQY